MNETDRVTHDPLGCVTCDLHWFLYGEVFIDTSTGKHLNPADMVRGANGDYRVKRGTGYEAPPVPDPNGPWWLMEPKQPTKGNTNDI